MVTIELRLLGPPSLIKASRPTRLHSAKTMALLAYLVLESETPHSREKLAGLLWGESLETRARHSLRQSLYSLRRELGSDLLALEDDALVFVPPSNLWVDVLEFLSLAPSDSNRPGLDASRQAADLYRGILLEGLELDDCPAFEEWLFFRRDDLDQRALGLLLAVVDGLIQQGNQPEALVYAQRLVRTDPLHEGAYRRLMQIHAASDDLDGIRRQYRICVGVLARELGVEPSAETQSLYRQLTAPGPRPPVAPEPPPTPQPGEGWLAPPFLGRERELAILQARLDQAVAGLGGLILVAGEAGMGKTRLVREFICRPPQASTPRLRYLSAQCYEPEAHAPYTVWGDILKPLSRPDWQPLLEDLAEAWRQQLACLVPDLGPPADDIRGTTAAESRLRLHQGVVQSLVCLTQSGPLLLWFDDLHWADEASLELLHYVSRHMARFPLLIIGTYGSDVTADAIYLDRLLGQTSQPLGPTALELRPLDRGAIDQMLTHLGVRWSEKLSVRLYQHSAGNPFLMVETLRTLIESGVLSQETDGGLVETADKRWPVPRRVQDLIQTRLTSLDEDARRVLAAGAVIGRPFGLRLLRRVSGLPESQVLDAMDRLFASAFIDEKAEAPPHSSLDFHHDYLRRVIYEGLRAVQRRALHGRAARALLHFYRGRPRAVTEEVAYHFEQAGDLQAIGYLTQAAQQAEELFAYQHATDLYSRALTMQRAEQADDLAGRFDLLLAREAVWDRQGRRTEQGEDVAELVALAKTLADNGRLAQACVRQAGFLTYTGEYARARQAGEQALALYRGLHDTRGEAHALRELGFLHWSTGDHGTALSYGREALNLHRRLGDVEGEATALHNLAEIHRSLGGFRQALAQYEGALNLYWARQNRRRQGLTLYGIAHAWRQLGEFDQALARYDEASRHCEAAGDWLMISRVHHALASLHWEIGGKEQALVHLSRALEISREIGYGPGIAHGLLALCHIQAQRGELNLARGQLQEALTWLQLMEDRAGLSQAQILEQALEQGTSKEIDLPTSLGWVKSHVALTEGKVYCEFESPIAQSRS